MNRRRFAYLARRWLNRRNAYKTIKMIQEFRNDGMFVYCPFGDKERRKYFRRGKLFISFTLGIKCKTCHGSGTCSGYDYTECCSDCDGFGSPYNFSVRQEIGKWIKCKGARSYELRMAENKLDKDILYEKMIREAFHIQQI